MINVAELLKDAPEGIELWCTLYGKIKFISVNSDTNYPIKVRLNDTTIEKFDKYGRYYNHFEDAECILFPSKECRTWEGWKVPSKPNFKVNDWIIFDKTITIPIQIVEVNQKDGVYRCKSIEGFYGHYNIAQTDKEYHLWSIADANDGDILTDGKKIVIFNKLEEPAYRQHIIAYIGLDLCGRLQITEDTWRLGVDKAMPATKEQRELLFKKMKEAGYQWDVDKKELRKIQPHYDIKNFKPFDKVLIRVGNNNKWTCDFFSYYHNGCFHCVGIDDWRQCIPFEGNEHLLGTTDMPSEEYINW